MVASPAAGGPVYGEWEGGRGTLVGLTEQHPDNPVQVLRRWDSPGAMWHVLARQGDAVTGYVEEDDQEQGDDPPR